MSFHEDLELGQKFEKLLEKELNTTFFYGSDNTYDAIDECGRTFEIKSEQTSWVYTGNHYCEYEQYTYNKWKPSGVAVTKADYWAVAFCLNNNTEWIIIDVNILKDYINENNPKSGYTEKEGDIPTKGYLISKVQLSNIGYNTHTFKTQGKNMRELKIGESVISGRAFNVKRKKVGEHKIQEFAIGVSKKNKDGEWTNGFFNVTLWGDAKVEDKQDIGLIGRIEPEHYTTKDGKEVKTFRFNANEIFEPKAWEKKGESKPQPQEEKEEELPW